MERTPIASCRMVCLIALALLALLGTAGPAPALPSKRPLWTSPIPAGDAVALSDGSLLLNGGREPGSALLVGTDGQVVAPVIHGGVRAATPDGNGGWLMAGSFPVIGGRNAGCEVPFVTRTDSAGNEVWTWTSHDNSPQCVSIDHVARAGNRVVIAGDFTRLGTATRRRVAALDLRDGKLSPWTVDLRAEGGSFEVTALGAAGETVYVGGTFDHANGAPRAGLAAVDGNGAVTPWHPAVLNGPQQIVPVAGAVLLVGTLILEGQEEAPPEPIVAVTSTNGARIPWRADISNSSYPDDRPYVEEIVVIGNLVYVAGDFDRAGGLARHGLAALRLSSGEATSWNPAVAPKEAFPAIAEAGGKLVVGIQQQDNTAEVRLSLLDAASGALIRRLPATTHEAPTRSTLTGSAGGQFLLAGEVASDALPQITRVLRSGREVPMQGVQFFVGPERLTIGPSDLALVHGRLFVAGEFDHVQGPGQPVLRRRGTAEIDPQSGRVLPWAPKLFTVRNRFVGLDGRDLVFTNFLARRQAIQLLRVNGLTGRIRRGAPIVYAHYSRRTRIAQVGAAPVDARDVLVFERRTLDDRRCTFGRSQTRFVLRNGRGGHARWHSAWLDPAPACQPYQPDLLGADGRRIFVQNIAGRIAGHRVRHNSLTLNRRSGRPLKLSLPGEADRVLSCRRALFVDVNGRVLALNPHSGRRLSWRLPAQQYGAFKPGLVPAAHGLAVLNGNRTRLFADPAVTPGRCFGKVRSG